MTCEEYDLLLQLNQITLAKYNDMTKMAAGLSEVSQRLNDKCMLLFMFLDHSCKLNYYTHNNSDIIMNNVKS